MKLTLQFGHGMMEHCRHLIEKWGEGDVIFSPRDMTETQIENLANDIVDRGGKIIIDPQFYDPRGDHHGLVKHDYWPDSFTTSMFMSGPPLNTLLSKIDSLNTLAQTDKVILPGLYGERIDEDWLAIQDAIVTEASSVIPNKQKLATICLSSEAIRYEEQIEMLLNVSEEWDVDGYYVVAEHPNGSYLAEDPLWLTNLLILCSGLKLQGREVIAGYSNQQMLCLACAGVDSIASGTWLNVRSFSTEKFQEPDSDSVSRRVKWYYCPQTLSEYKLPFLDMAFRKGVLDFFRTAPEYHSPYADILFSGAQPSTTDYSEQQSFRHYLTCLHYQCSTAKCDSFTETVDFHQALLDSVESQIRLAIKHGVRGQARDFREIVDVNRVAIDAFKDARGFVLDRLW